MVPLSPVDALGPYAADVREALVNVVRSVHDRFAEAHQVSGSRYTMNFGSQWRDLLAEAYDALKGRGFQMYKLPPAGYQLPVVNDCLVYVWRVPDSADTSRFASSPTKKNGFSAPPPDPMLFRPGSGDETEPIDDVTEEPVLERVVNDVGDRMPLVLVLVRSSPRQLQSMEWAIAELNQATGSVELYGQESIWKPEPNVGDAVHDVESFDSGTPNGPTIEPQKQEDSRSDA